MIFNKTKEQLNELKAIYTAQEIYQQPSTWKKTLQQMKDHKEEYQNFIDQVITQEDFDVVLCGAGSSEFVGNSIYTSLIIWNNRYRSIPITISISYKTYSISIFWTLRKFTRIYWSRRYSRSSVSKLTSCIHYM